jgi:hypothetical protein
MSESGVVLDGKQMVNLLVNCVDRVDGLYTS